MSRRKNGLDRLAQSTDAAALQFVKTKKTKKPPTVSVNRKRAKCTQTRHACTPAHSSVAVIKIQGGAE